MRWWRVVAASLVLVALLPGVAGAIETTRFGIEPTSGDRLVVRLRPGHAVTAEVDVWNKGDAPLVLGFEVVPATVAADGSVALEGPATAVAWADLPDRVRLAPKQRRTVELRMSAPKELPEQLPDLAVLAEPVATAGSPPPAVVQRLALVAHLRRGGRDLPDLWPAAGVAVLAIAAVFARIVVSRRRLRAGSRSR